MNLTLTDAASGAQGLVTFAGVLNGTVSTAGATITNTYTGETKKKLTLGGHTYAVAFDSFTPPTLTANGAFSADVTVTDAQPPPPPSTNTPEPSACVLAGLGLAAALMAGRKAARPTSVGAA
jgi:hypothetical protein